MPTSRPLVGSREGIMAVKGRRPRAFSSGRPVAAHAPARESKLDLGSGRTLHVRSLETGETIEVRSAANEVEVSIALGPGGPVVTVRGARELELASPRVAVRCDTLELEARERMNLASQGEIKLKAEGHVVVNGALVKLNCEESSPAS
jgi:hypothetical protein